MTVPSPERSGPWTMRPLRSFMSETPVSMTATPTPSPNVPCDHAGATPAVRTKFDAVAALSYEISSNCTVWLPEMEWTPGARATDGSASAGTRAENPSIMGSSVSTAPPADRTAVSASRSRPGRARTMTPTVPSRVDWRPRSTAPTACAGAFHVTPRTPPVAGVRRSTTREASSTRARLSAGRGSAVVTTILSPSTTNSGCPRTLGSRGR